MPIIVLSAVGDEDAEGARARGGRRRLRDQAVRRRASWSRACGRRCAGRRPRPRRAGASRADGLELDLAARRVRRDGEPSPPDPDRVRPAARARAQPRAGCSRTARCCRRSGARRTPRTSRRCAPTSPTCAARSSPTGDGAALHPHRPRRRLPLRRVSSSRNLHALIANRYGAVTARRPHVTAWMSISVLVAVAMRSSLLPGADRGAGPGMSAADAVRPRRRRRSCSRTSATRSCAGRSSDAAGLAPDRDLPRRLLTALTPLLGGYMARVYTGERVFLSPVVGPLERAVYRVLRVDPAPGSRTGRRMRAAVLVSQRCSGFALYLILRTQTLHPFNPEGFHSAHVGRRRSTRRRRSSRTRTGSSTAARRRCRTSRQMAGLAVQNFVSAAVGIAVARGADPRLRRARQQQLGNFWQDLDADRCSTSCCRSRSSARCCSSRRA